MLRVEKSKDLAPNVPADLKQSVTHIVGITMSYTGDVMVAAHGALFLLASGTPTAASQLCSKTATFSLAACSRLSVSISGKGA
jgi:hypothetical protein